MFKPPQNFIEEVENFITQLKPNNDLPKLRRESGDEAA